MFKSSDIVEIQGQNKNVTEKNISDRKEGSENRNDTASSEDPLNIYRTVSNETSLVSEIPSIMRKMV